MTGQGVGEAPLGSGRIVVEVRTVNHRYLDVRMRVPGELAEHASAAEDVVRRTLGRGRVEVTMHAEGEVAAPPVLDMARARSAFEQLVALRDAVAPGEHVPLTLLSTVPELFTSGATGGREAMREAVVKATEGACRATSAMRAREGEALARDFELRLARLLESLVQVETRIPQNLDGVRARLRERIQRLLDPNVTLDPGRLEHEVALLADRSDVTEEITRLRSHVAQFRHALHHDGEHRGKRIDFLCQEVARETNTLGQKNADAVIAALVIDMKVEIERMREQAQNVL